MEHATLDQLKAKTWKTKLLERIKEMQGVDRRNRLVERLVRKTQDGTLGTPTEYVEADEMIVMGDYISPQQSPPPPPHQKPPANIGKILLGAALAMGSLGAGAGAAMWGYSQLQDDTVTTIENTEGFLLEFPE